MPRDYQEYEDDYQEETFRNPLKPFLIALVVLLLLFAVIIGLLFTRLQSANTRTETLSQELTAARQQLDDLRAQQAEATDAPTPEPTNESPASCKSPCTEPSSPFSPCSSGKTTSMCSRTTQSFSKLKSPCPRTGEIAAGRFCGQVSHVSADSIE